MKTQKEQISLYCEEMRKSIARWKDINQNGCNDPFWEDGCNMNLVRNHIIYYKRMISGICKQNQLPLPDEYYFSVPPEVDTHYMANRKQKERVKRLESTGEHLVLGKYQYDENQICLF